MYNGMSFSSRESGQVVTFLGFTVDASTTRASVKYADKGEKLIGLDIRRYPHTSSAMPLSCIVGCIVGRLSHLYNQLLPTANDDSLNRYVPSVEDNFINIMSQKWSQRTLMRGVARFCDICRADSEVQRERQRQRAEKNYNKSRSNRDTEMNWGCTCTSFRCVQKISEMKLARQWLDVSSDACTSEKLTKCVWPSCRHTVAFPTLMPVHNDASKLEGDHVRYCICSVLVRSRS